MTYRFYGFAWNSSIWKKIQLTFKSVWSASGTHLKPFNLLKEIFRDYENLFVEKINVDLNNALVHRGMSNKILKYFFSHKNRLLYYNAKFVNSRNFIQSQRYNDVCFLVREMKYKYFVQRLWRLNRRRNERGDCRFTLLVNDRNRVKNAVLLSDWINEREWTLCAVCRSQKATSPVMFSCIFRLHLRPELILSAIMRKSSLHDGRHTFFSLFVT